MSEQKAIISLHSTDRFLKLRYSVFTVRYEINISIQFKLILIPGFRRDVDEICALLGYYAASCGNCLLTFRDNVSVPSSRIKSSSTWSADLMLI
jgi:hypothetical protein